MSLYDDLQSVAADTIGDFKQGSIRYGTITPGNGPVDNPGPSTTTWRVIPAVARGVKFKYVQNGMALASDLQVTFAGDVVAAPAAKDFVEIDGIPYKIVQIVPKPAAGTPVAFTLIVRK